MSFNYFPERIPPAKLLEIELGHEFPEKVMKDLYDPAQIGLKALIAGEVDSFEGGPQGVFAAVARGEARWTSSRTTRMFER